MLNYFRRDENVGLGAPKRRSVRSLQKSAAILLSWRNAAIRSLFSVCAEEMWLVDRSGANLSDSHFRHHTHESLAIAHIDGCQCILV